MTAYLICGAAGAGKTTYARKLQKDTGAVLFSMDEWMRSLFFPDAEKSPTRTWAAERVRRCERQMLLTAAQVLGAGGKVILDLGFFTKEQRRRVLRELKNMGAAAQLHYLPMEREERWARIERRNRERGATYAMPISRRAFDSFEQCFEAPEGDELKSAVIVKQRRRKVS